MNKKTQMIVEAGVMMALAYALSLVTIWKMPQGGSVTPGSMIPILIYAYRWGPKNGIFVGVVYGLIQFILGPKWSFHPVSVLFDYPIAFGALGFAGFFGKGFAKGSIGITVGIALRFVCHVISGVVVFASYAPEGMNPVLYSTIYNGSYLGIELIISVVVFALLFKPLERADIMKKIA
ncbi:energy-coupled thiamine transporter ThiT [Acidaminobacter sp. JC074]|uniref:energy-coupled thiamine transporter ThiT n=1 Tax=Acidaminobacter sp. JC074 TaxID=2530199 RepID=UPI001F111B07|nr:energy-coupled thiamine transporter ThiT [Acidaminobacter sp. JC074]MCH4891301.1 energy-coupled thiamine transporter ThiT [Acidaminobacter sp. JC074]